MKAGTVSDASIDPARAVFVQIVPEKTADRVSAFLKNGGVDGWISQ